jgi:hypothetical protein
MMAAIKVVVMTIIIRSSRPNTKAGEYVQTSLLAGLSALRNTLPLNTSVITLPHNASQITKAVAAQLVWFLILKIRRDSWPLTGYPWR